MRRQETKPLVKTYLVSLAFKDGRVSHFITNAENKREIKLIQQDYNDQHAIHPSTIIAIKRIKHQDLDD